MDATEAARQEVQASMRDVRTALDRTMETTLVLLGHLIGPVVREHADLADVTEVTLEIDDEGFPHGFSAGTGAGAETADWAVEKIQGQSEIYNLLFDLVWCRPGSDTDEKDSKIIIKLPIQEK